MEKRRAGLDVHLRLWIILDEINEERTAQSYYLEPAPPLGKFSRAYFIPIVQKLISRREKVRAVRRF